MAERLTEGFREPKHFLVVDVCLVPDEVIGQVRGCGKPLPEEAALNGHHEVHLHEVEGDGGVREADPQDRLVARGTAAQVAQPHLAARDGDLLLQRLGRQITRQVALRDSRHKGRWKPHALWVTERQRRKQSRGTKGSGGAGTRKERRRKRGRQSVKRSGRRREPRGARPGFWGRRRVVHPASASLRVPPFGGGDDAHAVASLKEHTKYLSSWCLSFTGDVIRETHVSR